mgnify:CR=1 FL=1
MSKFQFQMIKQNLFRIWVIGIYLGFGLPARSRFGEGRCLVFGTSYFYSVLPSAAVDKRRTQNPFRPEIEDKQ